MKVIVREMSLEDLDASSELSIKARVSFWEKYDYIVYPREYLEDELKLYDPIVLKRFVEDEDKYGFVAEVDGRIIGIIIGKITYGIFDISWIAVEPEWQGRSIGRRLLEAAIQYSRRRGCHKMIAYTLPIAISTIGFYLKMGFVPECYMRKHWRKLDFIMMSKFI